MSERGEDQTTADWNSTGGFGHVGREKGEGGTSEKQSSISAVQLERERGRGVRSAR